MKSIATTASSLIIVLSFLLAPCRTLWASETGPKDIATYHIMTKSRKPAGTLILCVGDITELHNVDAIVNAANYHLEGGSGVDNSIHLKAGKKLLAFNERIAGITEDDHTQPTRCPEGQARISPAFDLFNSQNISYIISTNGPKNTNAYKETLLRACYVSSISIAAQINSQFTEKNLNLSLRYNDLSLRYNIAWQEKLGVSLENPWRANFMSSLATAWKDNFALFTEPFKPINSLAFPLISTGAFGYSVAGATPVALSAIISYMKDYAETLQTLKASKQDNAKLEQLTPLTVYIVVFKNADTEKNVKIYQDVLTQYIKKGAVTLQPDPVEDLTILASQLELFARTSH